MKMIAMLRICVASAMAALAVVCVSSGVALGEEPLTIAAAEEAAKKVAAVEDAAQNEWNSREMARSATREISRAERSRSEGAVADFRRAEQAVTQLATAAKAARQAADAEQDPAKKAPLAEAATKAENELSAARGTLEQRLATRRAAIDRLIADSVAGDRAAHELLTSEDGLRDKMAATRAAERQVLELKAAGADQAAATAAEQAQQALATAEKLLSDDRAAAAAAEQAVAALKRKADEKAKADAARRAIYENQAVTAWEIQLWAAVQKGTLAQIVEMTDHAGRIATDAAALETEPARKKAVEEFAQLETRTKAAAEKSMAQLDAIIDAAHSKIYPLRSAAMGGLKPLAAEAWDYDKARHLLARAGFGGTSQEVQKLHAMGLYKAVDYLVDFHNQPSARAGLDVVPLALPDPLEGKLRNAFIRGQAAGPRQSVDGTQLARLRQWWLKRMVESPRPLQEKLALFWHGHFATQQSVVQNSYTLYHQNQLFREHAAGNFGGLLYGIVHDPVMIRYLDNNLNVKGHANENLAREIMELFAMGVDQGYTEGDIREAARALTGYTYDHHSGQFRVVHDKHDTGDKTVFGQKGPWTGDDLVRLILDQPSTARFISTKLFENFAHKDPTAETVDRLASVFRAGQYELNPLLKNLFLSEEFYSAASMGTQIKSPTQLVVGLLRDVGIKEISDYGQLDGLIQEMGQQLFEPPDVKGWRQGRSWISTNRLFIRYNAVAQLTKSVAQPNGVSGVDVVGLLAGDACKSPADVVACLTKTCFARPLNEEQRKKLVEFLGQLPPQQDWVAHKEEVNGRLRAVLVLMLSTPEYQSS